MAKVQVTASGAGMILPRKRVAVETRATWASDWVRQPYVECVSDTRCCAPAIGEAVFKYRYGEVAREGRASFDTYQSLDLLDNYIQVVDLETGAPLWTGRVVDDSAAPFGGVNVDAGWQMFTAFGLLHELDRSAINSAHAVIGGATQELQHAPAFNGRSVPKLKLTASGVQQLGGNRSTAKNSGGVYEFGGDELWTNRQAAEYILKYYTPQNGPTYQLGGQAEILDNLHTQVEIEGRTPYEVLCELIDRRRGLGFAEVCDGETVTLFVYSTLDSALTYGGVTIPANAQPVALDLDLIIELQDIRIRSSSAIRFEKIEVRGNRVLSCATFGYPDGTLVEGWTSAQAAAAWQGGLNSYPDYANLTEAEQANVNDAIRQSDALAEVYSKHTVPDDWDGRTGDGQGGSQASACPTIDDQGEVESGPAPHLAQDKSFEAALPFLEGYNYGVWPPAQVAASTVPAYQRPFAVIEDPDTGDWHLTDRPGPDVEGGEADLRIMPRELAVSVSANPRYAYADGHWNTVEPYNEDPVFDYDYLAATLAFRTDQVVRCSELRLGAASGGPIRTKVIQVPDAELWYVAPNTIVGIGPDLEPVYYGGPRIMRDDRPRLREVLAAALAWYSVERRALTIDSKYRFNYAELGMLLRAVYTAESVIEANSVVTTIRRDWAAQRQTVETSYAELDWSVKDE